MLERFSKGKKVTHYKAGAEKRKASNRLSKNFLPLGLTVTMAVSGSAFSQAQEPTRNFPLKEAIEKIRPANEKTVSAVKDTTVNLPLGKEKTVSASKDSTEKVRPEKEKRISPTKDAISYIEKRMLCTPEQAKEYRALRQAMSDMDLAAAKKLNPERLSVDLYETYRAFETHKESMAKMNRSMQPTHVESVDCMIKGLAMGSEAVGIYQETGNHVALLRGFVEGERKIGGSDVALRGLQNAFDAGCLLKDGMDEYHRAASGDVSLSEQTAAAAALQIGIDQFDEATRHRFKARARGMMCPYGQGISKKGEAVLKEELESLKEQSDVFRGVLDQRFAPQKRYRQHRGRGR